MPILLDVNLLVALAWPAHVHHAAAQAWFVGARQQGWATTPGTEAGFIRVSMNPAVTDRGVSWSGALEMIAAIRATPGHAFWPDDLDLLGSQLVRRAPIVGHRQVTDVHLAALAAAHEGQLATLDRSVRDALHPDDRDVVVLVPPGTSGQHRS